MKFIHIAVMATNASSASTKNADHFGYRRLFICPFFQYNNPSLSSPSLVLFSSFLSTFVRYGVLKKYMEGVDPGPA